MYSVNQFISVGSVHDQVPEGTTLVIDLSRPQYCDVTWPVNSRHYTIESAFDLAEEADEMYQLMLQTIRAGKRIAIVCDDGVSVAPALVIYYLMNRKQMRLESIRSKLIKKIPRMNIQADIYDYLTLEDKGFEEDFSEYLPISDTPAETARLRLIPGMPTSANKL